MHLRLCVNVYAYKYIYMCLCLYIYIYIYTHIHIYIYMCVLVCVWVHGYMFICIYVSMCIYLYIYCDVEFYSDLKRSISWSLSSVEGCYVEFVSPRAVWHMTLNKINPGKDSYFGRMINRQIMWRLIRGQTDLRCWEGGANSLSHTPTSPLSSYPLRSRKNELLG